MQTSIRKSRGRLNATTLSVAAVLLVAGMAGGGCGGDDDPPATGGSGPGGSDQGGSSGSGAGTAGAGGNPAGGTGGAGATGGADAGPDSSSGAGGTSGTTGGTAGAGATGGSAGSSDAGPCGNGRVDPGEQCDDSNAANGDGCSSSCVNTARCEACEQQYCKAADADFDYVLDLCLNDMEPASDGPAAGRRKNDLCKALLSCLRNTNCSNSGDPLTSCYCGTLTPAECNPDGSQPNGPCVAEMQAAGESRSTSVIDQRYLGADYALGRALTILQLCDGSACQFECQLNRPADACSRCTVGPGAIAGPSTRTCSQIAACYGTYPERCSPIVDCARRSGCASQGAAACYGGGTGPCATEVTAALGSLTAEEVLRRLKELSDNESNAAAVGLALAECQARECSSACIAGTADAGGG